MQKTNFSIIVDKLNIFLFGFISSSWKLKSVNIITLLLGYFLFANFLTKFISEGKNELIMVPVIMSLTELIIRIKPSSKSKIFKLWLIADKLRIGASYAVILEAFKLGS